MLSSLRLLDLDLVSCPEHGQHQLASIPSAKAPGGSSSHDPRIIVGSTDNSGPTERPRKNGSQTPRVCATLAYHSPPWEERTDSAPGVQEVDRAKDSASRQQHVERSRWSQRLGRQGAWPTEAWHQRSAGGGVVLVCEEA